MIDCQDKTLITAKTNSNPLLPKEGFQSDMKFQDELIGLINQSEARLLSKMSSIYSQHNKSRELYETSIASMNTKYDQIAQSIAMLSVKFDRLNDYEAFSSKTKEDLTLHEVKLSNLAKDLSNASFKYDRIFLDNLLLPGFIGDCCKYRTTKEFFNDVIIQLSTLNAFKEKQVLDLQTYKEKLDSMMKSLNCQADVILKLAMKYTQEAINENNAKLKERFKEVNHLIEELNLANNRYSLELKEKTIDLNELLRKMNALKEEILAKFEAEIAHYKQDNRTTHLLFNEYKAEFKVISRKFKHLAAFIKDVRFRSNLRMLIKRNEISLLYNKMSSQSRKSFDATFEERKSDRKSLTQGAVDFIPYEIGVKTEDHSSQEKTIEKKSKVKSRINEAIVNSAQVGKVYPIKLQDKTRFAVFDYHNNALKQTSIHNHSRKSIDRDSSMIDTNENKLKREQQEINRKLLRTERKFTALEAFTKNKFKELSNAIAQLIPAAVNANADQSQFSFIGLPNIDNLQSRSSSHHTCRNGKATKEKDLKPNSSAKPIHPITVIDLAQSNPVPPREQLNRQNNLDTIKRHKAATKQRVSSAKTIHVKASVKSSAIIPDEDSQVNLKSIPMSNFLPCNNHRNRSSISHPTVSESKVNKKVDSDKEKKDCYSIIGSYKWVPVKRIKRVAPEAKDEQR